MSGGSFNYLCHKDASELVNELDGDLKRMIEELAALPDADTALAQTVLVRALLQRAVAQVDQIVNKNGLSEVWRAVEWWRSGDSDQDGAIYSAKKFEEKIMSQRGSESQ